MVRHDATGEIGTATVVGPPDAARPGTGAYEMPVTRPASFGRGGAGSSSRSPSRFPAAAVDRAALPPVRSRPVRRSHRPAVMAVLALLVLAGVAVGVAKAFDGPRLSPLRSSIVSVAESQVGYRTDPPDSYCNKYSAYWGVGTECGGGLRSEEWCADFAAWVWHQAGALVTYQFVNGDLNSSSASFYEWGLAHGTWHPVDSGYTPQPGDVAVYGLDTSTLVAAHVAVVVSYSPGTRGPDVINGDGDHTGFSVVEPGTDQYQADTKGGGEPLSGYVSPSAPPTAGDTTG